MPEWIQNLAIACSPEEILHRHEHACAGGHGPLNQSAGVFDLNRDSPAGSAQRLWRLERAALAGLKLIAEKKRVTVQNDLTVHQASAVWGHHPVSFFRAKESLCRSRSRRVRRKR